MSSVMKLIKYEAMKVAISECHALDEAKNIRDKHEALTVYAKQLKDRTAEIQFAEIRLRAERRFGEISRALPKDVGGRPDGNFPPIGGSKLLALESVGVTTQDASRQPL
jgi:hypothetical protein